jgi:hypothetical protein
LKKEAIEEMATLGASTASSCQEVAEGSNVPVTQLMAKLDLELIYDKYFYYLLL